MKKTVKLTALAGVCALAIVLGVGCSPQADVIAPDGSGDNATVKAAATGDAAETADASEADLPEIAPNLPASDGMSLVEYHEGIGQDISAVTEVSAEACGSCHGSIEEIQSATDGVLVMDDTVQSPSANPHVNHYMDNLDCSNCHNLEGGSTLYCTSCHDWKLTKDNGTWGTN